MEKEETVKAEKEEGSGKGSLSDGDEIGDTSDYCEYVKTCGGHDCQYTCVKHC